MRLLHHLCMEFQQVEETYVGLQVSVEHHFFFLNADVVVGAGLRTDESVSAIYRIEDHSFYGKLLHETT